MGSEMFGPGSGHSRFVNRDHSSVGVGDQTVAIASTISHRVSAVHSTIDTMTQETKVLGTGSSHGRLINGDHSSVGMGNQVGVEVQGSSIAIVVHWGSDSYMRGGHKRGSDSDRSGHERSMEGLLMCDTVDVVSTGSGHSRFVQGDHGTVGVGDQVGV
jgi:hypothetical protein